VIAIPGSKIEAPNLPNLPNSNPSMGVEGLGRRKRGSAEISKEDNESNYSGQTKKKSKNQPTYNGPPAYLLDAKRTDPFADPRNVIQDMDGTNRPINYGGKSHPSTQEISESGPSTDTDSYLYGIPPIESRSEREASRAASEVVDFEGQDQPLSNPPSDFKTNHSHNNSLPRRRRKKPSTEYRTKLGAIKLGLKLDLKQTSISTRGRTSSQTGLPNSNISQQAIQILSKRLNKAISANYHKTATVNATLRSTRQFQINTFLQIRQLWIVVLAHLRQKKSYLERNSSTIPLQLQLNLSCAVATLFPPDPISTMKRSCRAHQSQHNII